MDHDKTSAELHMKQRAKESRLVESISPILYKEFKEFFILGMKEKINQIKPNLETIQANIDNSKISDEEFRAFIKTIVPELLERICKV